MADTASASASKTSKTPISQMGTPATGTVTSNKIKNFLSSAQEQITNGFVSTATEIANKASEIGKAAIEGAQNLMTPKASNTETADTKPPLIPPNQFSTTKGMVSIPSPGAHVWVMFENGDPNYPIVLGNILGKGDYHGVYEIQKSTPTNQPAPETTAPPDTPGDPNAPKPSGSTVEAADAWQKKIQNGGYTARGQYYNGHSQGYCFRGVKTGLLEGGVTTGYMDGISAKNAGPSLLSNGFTKTNITDARQAPPGSVIVYGGGRHGHIEMRTSDGGYVSDFYSRNPPNPQNRPVLGIYTK